MHTYRTAIHLGAAFVTGFPTQEKKAGVTLSVPPNEVMDANVSVSARVLPLCDPLPLRSVSTSPPLRFNCTTPGSPPLALHPQSPSSATVRAPTLPQPSPPTSSYSLLQPLLLPSFLLLAFPAHTSLAPRHPPRSFYPRFPHAITGQEQDGSAGPDHGRAAAARGPGAPARGRPSHPPPKDHRSRGARRVQVLKAQGTCACVELCCCVQCVLRFWICFWGAGGG